MPAVWAVSASAVAAVLCVEIYKGSSHRHLATGWTVIFGWTIPATDFVRLESSYEVT